MLSRLTGRHLDAYRHPQAELWARVTAWALPDWPGSWYHLGLVYKRQARWHASQRANAAAGKLHPEYEPAWWNMGIAATARGDWGEARRAWTAYGIDLPEGSGAPDMNIGLTPIRLDPEGRAEVVWTMRLDPARARIVSVPLPPSNRRYGDVVLHDGVPTGERVLDGEAVPVFDELELLVQSPYGTFHADVRVEEGEDFADLVELSETHGVRAQNWTATIRHLPREVSEGSAPAFEDLPIEETAQLGIAARTQEDARAFLTAWTRARAGRELLDLHLGLRGTEVTA